jgi:hypothetical protein
MAKTDKKAKKPEKKAAPAPKKKAAPEKVVEAKAPKAEKAPKPPKAAKAPKQEGPKVKGKRGKKNKEPLTQEQTETLKNDIAAKYSDQEKKPYRMNETFEVNVILEHPKFGVGQVIAVLPHKIDVQFGDMVRSLVHNRSFN